MQIKKNIQVSIKCRIGLGDKLNYDFFEEFIDEIIKSGIKVIYVHARNAILTGISPKANRTIPTLDYSFVKKIKTKYPSLTFILNGGIDSIEKALEIKSDFDGIMVGRLIQNNPFCLKNVDQLFYNTKEQYDINENTIHEYFDYIKPRVGKESIFRLMSPLLNIFFGIPNSKNFKAVIHDNMQKQKVDILEKIFLEFIKQNNFLIN